MAHRIATDAGLPDPEAWPWSWTTASGMEAWSQFGDQMVDKEPLGFWWAEAKLNEMAAGATTRTDAWTPAAREKIPLIPDVVAQLRRDHISITKSAVATKLEVDRGTLQSWISNGWTPWPPD